MKTLIAVLLIGTILAGCDKSYENPNNTSDIDLNGRFIGTFHRTGGSTSNVNILFSGNNFEGESDQMKYPAICRGSFSVDQTNDDITFDNSCTWTADFDWTLILDGKYDFKVNEDQALIIYRTENGVTDEYKLYRMSR